MWSKEGGFLDGGHYDFRPLVRMAVGLNQEGIYVCLSMEPFDKFFNDYAPGLKPSDAFEASVGYIKDLIKECGGESNQ